MSSSADTMPQAHFQSQDALEQSYWWHVNRRTIALAWLHQLGVTRPRLLDLGCGTGGFLTELAAATQSPRALGLDASPVALDFAAHHGLDVRQEDLSRPLQLNEEPFDVATAMDVMEHLPDEKPLLETARLNLRTGGYFIASVPAYTFMFSTWDEQVGHYRRYTRPLLLKTVSGCGFTVVRCTYAFSYALLPAMARRIFGKAYSNETCVFPPMPRHANRALLSFGSLEAAFLSHASLPFGLSVFILARK
ncbi:MAG: methyltransferase domain-containing protein [bacterium]